MSDVPLDSVAIDVGTLVRRTVTSLYSSLVTRPTGRAVRLAIQAQLADARRPTLSVIDLSEVTVLDFSCADEVVAKLVGGSESGKAAAEAFFVFRGVHEPHRDQIEVVLRRQGLAVVAEVEPERFGLLGEATNVERVAWGRVEERGLVSPDDVEPLFPSPAEREALDRLAARHLVFRSPVSGRLHALSRLARHLF